MTRYTMTGQGTLIPYTPAEEAAADAADAALHAAEVAKNAAAPMENWLEQMAASDKTMTRSTEDLIDRLIATDVIQATDLNEFLSNNWTAKKELRAQKPA